ncbi:hypothetical protein [Haladaptatus sp. YSMS36]|uniref:hypothetical protein n=1 Tax=Haladaptatus sp. YSMS36 TaxID=3033384 RepID=UPI0023E8D070|nr:hypothetical protein [Haladaptatus sp. YSMS36]
MYAYAIADVPAPYTVKARGRHGTESLDLTIPVGLKREYGIVEGDVFLVEVDQEGDDLLICYKRIHKAESPE